MIERLDRELKNITSAVEAQCTSSVWDPKTKTLSLKYQLLNSSNDIITGPLKMRIVQLESDLGVPRLISANGKYGGGAMLNLLNVIPPKGLLPGETTKPQQLQVRFDRVNQLNGINQRDVVRMKIRVYGNRLSLNDKDTQ
jgi:hypothetical protein